MVDVDNKKNTNIKLFLSCDLFSILINFGCVYTSIYACTQNDILQILAYK